MSWGSGPLGSRPGAFGQSWPIPHSKDAPPKWHGHVCALALAALWWGQESQPTLKSRCGRSGSCLVPGCHVPHSLSPIQRAGAALVPDPDLAVGGTWQSPVQWRSSRSQTQLDANACCQVYLGPPPQSFPTQASERVQGWGVPVAPPVQTLGILHPPLCQWLLHLVWLS